MGLRLEQIMDTKTEHRNREWGVALKRAARLKDSWISSRHSRLASRFLSRSRGHFLSGGLQNIKTQAYPRMLELR